MAVRIVLSAIVGQVTQVKETSTRRVRLESKDFLTRVKSSHFITMDSSRGNNSVFSVREVKF